MSISEPTGKLRAGIYARISEADEKVDKTADQVKVMKGIAADYGYEVVATLVDDDISAFEGKNPRPAFAELVARTMDGDFDVVMATEMSRFTRGSSEELQALQFAAVKNGAVIHTRASGVQDVKEPMVAGMQKMQDVWSWIEVATIRWRVKNRNANDRARGLPMKSMRAFGWQQHRAPLTPEKAAQLGWEWWEGAEYIPVDEEEAAVLRDAFSRLLDGSASLWGLAREFTEKGYTTAAMGRMRKHAKRPEPKMAEAKWVASQVRQLVERPRNAGILIFQGEEQPVSRIEPIISREQHTELLAHLENNKLTHPQKTGPKESYLLSGLLYCPCGDRTYRTVSYSQRKGGPRNVYGVYQCRAKLVDRTKKHVTINQNIVEAVIQDHVFAKVLFGDLPDLDDGNVADEIQAVNTRLLEIALETDFQSDLSTDFQKPEAARKKADLKLKALENEQRALLERRDVLNAQRAEGGALAEFAREWRSQPFAGKEFTTEEATDFMKRGTQAWLDLDMSKKRDIIKALVRVTIKHGGRGDDRIKIQDVQQPATD